MAHHMARINNRANLTQHLVPLKLKSSDRYGLIFGIFFNDNYAQLHIKV